MAVCKVAVPFVVSKYELYYYYSKYIYIIYLLGFIFFPNVCKYVKLGVRKKWVFLTISQGKVMKFWFTYCVWTLSRARNILLTTVLMSSRFLMMTVEFLQYFDYILKVLVPETMMLILSIIEKYKENRKWVSFFRIFLWLLIYVHPFVWYLILVDQGFQKAYFYIDLIHTFTSLASFPPLDKTYWSNFRYSF